MTTAYHTALPTMTVGQLAGRGGMSRTALLYYDRIGLLRPSGRSGGNYRIYLPADVERLRQIRFYRRIGIPLGEIRQLLDRDRMGGRSEGVLRRRLESLENEIESLQEQQQQIVRLLEHFPRRSAPAKRSRGGGMARAARIPPACGSKESSGVHSKENTMISKDKWVEVMKAAGFSEQDMQDWHRSFEKMEPAGHQEFLESLGLGKEEIRKMRERFAR